MVTSVIVWELIFWFFTGIIALVAGMQDSSVTKQQLFFVNPEVFWLLLLLLPIIGMYLYSLNSSNKLGKASNPTIRKFNLKPISSRRSFLNYFFFRNACVFLLFAMAQPVFGTKKVSATLDSLELVVCLDISNSMNTKDISKDLTRLQIAKRALTELVNNLKGEKLGIAVFAGGAIVQLPLTSDYASAKLFISEIETNMISNQGTNISAALVTSMEMFSADKSTKGIILVTDGENHEEDPSEILGKLKTEKVQLSVLGIGTTQGGPVPVHPERPELGLKKMANGQIIVSRVNSRFLEEIAEKGGGFASVSSDAFPNLSVLLTQINQMKRTKVKDFEFEIEENQYQIPLFAAVVFWCLFLLGSKNIFTLKMSEQ